MTFKAKVLYQIMAITTTILVVYIFLLRINNDTFKIRIVIIVTYIILVIFVLIKCKNRYFIKDEVIYFKTISSDFSININEILYIKEVWSAYGRGNSKSYEIVTKNSYAETIKIDISLRNENNQALLTVLINDFNIKLNSV